MIVASRYAKSLMELATEHKKLDAVRADMKMVEKVYNENREFALFLDSPVIKTDKKLAVLNSLFKGKTADLTLQFLTLLTKKKRESYLNDIAKEFEEQYRKNQNIFSAVVTSAKGLDEMTRKKVLDLVKAQLKGEVELVEKVDPSTIGGFVLRIGDSQIDKSVARQLSNLKKELINKSN
jgi:F-type H+-transporting ATPase subunit delta